MGETNKRQSADPKDGQTTPTPGGGARSQPGQERGSAQRGGAGQTQQSGQGGNLQGKSLDQDVLGKEN